MPDFRAPLRRSRSNRLLGGVVAGLAEYFGLDVTLARVLYVIAAVVSAAFPGLIVYVILWAVMPVGE
jgi:phage shock protein PspC (stress-responsive transcriptional regulator)